jgi:hypothetical protein
MDGHLYRAVQLMHENINLIMQYRSFLKDSIRKSIDFSQTDQNRGITPPPVTFI